MKEESRQSDILKQLLFYSEFFDEDLYLSGGMANLQSIMEKAIDKQAPSAPEQIKTVLKSPGKTEDSGEKTSKPVIKKFKKLDIPYKGSFLREILVLVEETDGRKLYTDEKNLLFDILSAINLNVNDVAIVSYSKSGNDFNGLCSKFEPKKIICFGVEPKSDSIKMNEVQQIGKIKLVMSEPLSKLLTNKELKKKLWIALKDDFMS